MIVVRPSRHEMTKSQRNCRGGGAAPVATADVAGGGRAGLSTTPLLEMLGYATQWFMAVTNVMVAAPPELQRHDLLPSLS